MTAQLSGSPLGGPINACAYQLFDKRTAHPHNDRMIAIDWKNWLTQWSCELLARLDFDAIDADELPLDAPLAEEGMTPNDVVAHWFGYPGASEGQLAQLETHLNTHLPPSYRAFLQTSNGWRQPSHVIPNLWSTAEIDWFAARNQAYMSARLEPKADTGDEE